MKKLTLSKKILIVLLSSIAFTILFSFFFIHFLYSNLYLSSIEDSIIYQGKRTASHYHYGELSDEIIEKIQWYNIVSEYEIIVVDQLEDLTSYFPYKVNYEDLVNNADNEQLKKGAYVLKEGYVEELDREILGAIFPIKGENGLIGFIYIYVPLAAIQDVFKESIPILLIVGILFFFTLFLVINRVWRSLFRPLKMLQKLSTEVSKGNYSNRIETGRTDEIGQLANAFNTMSLSLEEQEQRKKEFTSNLVHELRTPLTYINGYTHALKEKIYSSPEEAESYLATIEKETIRLNKLINDLVELNQLQEELYVLVHEPIVIAQIVLDTLDLFHIRMTEKKLTLQQTIEEDLILIGDPQRIQQVIYNVLDNAVKYSSTGETIVVHVKKMEDGIEFRVSNQGILIAKEDINRIGERFFRTDKARNRTTGGTGLGLSIVKEIVRLHGGTFSIKSDTTLGTEVTIRLLDEPTTEKEAVNDEN
ncbi:HAMP domain-containing sensor histidine kinase [Sporosarcina oncorhynchi]|uniref:histidine kinase n=1 Tax=Sporosarcina oncorhynchi TaxID=3056444 RepID=A0ABZ0LAA8_9BACL|nr:HAMP domain-containing sensor histidine kinase [Sporosarcina sp. T2O-4]WOV88496.1 HAMP domain-containing sensor histidine kinase [Sporosarcina sp. T2O-4]